MQSLDVSCQGFRLRIEIESEHDPRTWLHNVAPPFQCEEPRDSPQWRLRVVEPLGRVRLDRELPTYSMAGTSTLVQAWDQSGVELYCEDDQAQGAARVVSRYRDQCTTIEVDSAAQNRWPQRFVKLFFGSRLLSAGWTAFHASSVGFGGRGVLFCGLPGTGKSTFAHLAGMHPSTEFLSDDMTLVSPQRPCTLLGWPDRIAVPSSTLQATMGDRLPQLQGLRRSRLSPPVADPENPGRVLRGERYAFDRSEHSALLGVSHGLSAPLSLIVLAHCDPDREGDPVITPVDPRLAREDLPRHLASTTDQRFLLDILGVFGGRSAPADAPQAARLAEEVPVARMIWGTKLQNQRSAPQIVERYLKEMQR